MIKDYPQKLLRRNHSSALPSRMLFLDTETNPEPYEQGEIHTMRLAWSCYYERRGGPRKDTEIWLPWTKARPMWDYIAGLVHDQTQLYVFAHNIFFDLQSSWFFPLFTKWGWVLDFIHDKGLTYILVIRKGKKTIRLLSTTNWFDTKLSSLGDMIDLPKLEIDFNDTSDEALSVYCRRDVEIIKRVMLDYMSFVESNDLGKFAMTRAAQSLAAYRHRFMNQKIYIHDDEPIIDLEEKAYIGGRTECLSLGIQSGGPFLTLDINSMYPYVMRQFKYPYQLVDYKEHVNQDHLKEILDKYACVGNVKIATDDPIYALRHHGKIIFPVGEFETFLCTGGLKEALKRGHILDIKQLSIYRHADLFSSYVNYFYDLRQEAKTQENPVYTRVLKLFLNSLYGKFAQWQPETVETDDITFDGYWRMPTYDFLTGQTDMEIKLLNKVVRTIGRKPGARSFIAIAAHVTEYARLLLWTIIEQIGIDSVLYCDTDSVKIRAEDLPLVSYKLNDMDLGALKVESSSDYLDIRGSKNYVTETERKIKGVPVSAVEIAPYTFQYMTFLGQVAHLNRQVESGNIVQKTSRRSPYNYDKGNVSVRVKITPFRFEPGDPPF